MCGEHLARAQLAFTITGSSPRVRGTLGSHFPVDAHCGIIPACAGNTLKLPTRSTYGRDHPRVCGEHFMKLDGTLALTGSSPRVRGTPVVRQGKGQVRGIIPACAGNTSHIHAKRSPRRDHPRVCGEHRLDSIDVLIGQGSSPRVRGTPHVELQFERCRGIIPACAGNTRA